MRAFALCIVALGLAVSPAMAGAGGPTDNASGSANTTAKETSSSNSAAAQPAEPSSLQLESEMQQLRDLIEAQSAQLQAQSDQLKAAQAQMQQLQEQLAANGGASANAVTANVAAAPAPIGPSLSVPASASTGSPSSNGGAAGQEPAPPTSISYKGITLTPGGFMAAETVWRQKAMGSDVNTPFNSVPLPGASQANMDEFNASGRQSRISMLVEGKLPSVKIGGYYEMDFLSAGTTSNNNQSNSYTMRQRQFWGQAAFTNGITFTGGQQWSLITETTHGMDNRTENLPMTIDAQYHAGFSWARQYGVRLVKNFDNKFWLGFSVEESQSTLTVHGNPTANSGGSTVCVTAACTGSTGTTVVNPTVLNNFLVGEFGTSGGLYNPLGNYAFNLAPDFIVKAVWEPGFGHYEVFGVLSSFRDRAFPCVPITGTTPPAGCASITSPTGAFNDSREGGGGGANARWSIAKKVDLGIHFFGGDGIGRYGSAGLSDATVRPNGTLALLRNYQALGTLQLHPVSKLDVYMNVGGEFAQRAEYTKSGSTPNEGYGAVGLSNAGCWTETLPVTGPSTSSNTGVPTGVGGSTGFIPGPLANCTGDARNIVEGTLGFWYRFYNGPKGRFQFGMQYSNFVKNTWRGVAGTGPAISGQPHADQNMVFTSFRYYLP